MDDEGEAWQAYRLRVIREDYEKGLMLFSNKKSCRHCEELCMYVMLRHPFSLSFVLFFKQAHSEYLPSWYLVSSSYGTSSRHLVSNP